MRRVLAAGLSWLGRRSTVCLAAGFLIAIALPALAETLRPLLPLAVAGLLVVATLRIDPLALRAIAARPGLVLAATLAMLLIAPVLVWAIARSFALPPGLFAALVLGAALPPLFSVPAMSAVLGLDVVLALCVVTASTVISPFTLGPLAALLLDLDLAISPFALVARLAGLVLGAIAVGFGLRALIGRSRIEAMDAPLAGIVVVLMLLFAVAIMHGVPAAFVADPRRVLVFIVAAFALNAGLQAVTVALAWRAGRRRALTLGFASGNRSLGLLLAVLPASADPALGLFFALGQFPIYLLPMLLVAPYRSLLARDR